MSMAILNTYKLTRVRLTVENQKKANVIRFK